MPGQTPVPVLPADVAAVCARLRRGEADTADLELIARRSLEGIRAAFAGANQILGGDEPLFEFHLAGKVATEGAEVLDAYQRWTGWSRRGGHFSEVEDEAADVIISALLLMEQADGALWTAMAAKIEKIFTRGWKDAPTDGQNILAEADAARGTEFDLEKATGMTIDEQGYAHAKRGGMKYEVPDAR